MDDKPRATQTGERERLVFLLTLKWLEWNKKRPADGRTAEGDILLTDRGFVEAEREHVDYFITADAVLLPPPPLPATPPLRPELPREFPPTCLEGFGHRGSGRSTAEDLGSAGGSSAVRAAFCEPPYKIASTGLWLKSLLNEPRPATAAGDRTREVSEPGRPDLSWLPSILSNCPAHNCLERTAFPLYGESYTNADQSSFVD